MPPTLTYPGVYIEELPSGVHTITGVATSIAAFIGWAPKGPTTEARLVESWTEYQTLYGGLDARSYMGYSVNQFFANGGQQAYIVRLVWDGSVPAAVGTSPALATTAVVTGAGYGTTEITASVGAITSPPITLSIGPPVLQSLSISPAVLPPVPIGSTVKFTASGINSDGSSSPVPINWSSSDPTILSFGAGGLATAKLQGTVVVTATSGFVTGTTIVTVTPTPLKTGAGGFTITALTPAPAVGQTQQLVATFVYADGTTQDVTKLVAWDSTAKPKATVSDAGLVSGVGSGSANVTATLAALTTTPALPAPSFPVTVGIATRVAINIFPGSVVVQKSKVVTFTAIETLSDGTTKQVVGGTWSCSNTAITTIAPNGGDPNKEDATAVAIGSATISVTSGAFSASATLNVTAATLNSILITPVNPTVAANNPAKIIPALQLQLNALGIYSDGTHTDLTQAVGWVSSASADASVDPNTGVVTGINAGKTPTMTASFQGVSATTSVAVTAPVPLSIAITPDPVNLASGGSKPLKATGTLSDGSTTDLTTTAAWNTSAPNVANVSLAGIATAKGQGGSLTLFAANPGAWGNDLRIVISANTDDPTRFGLLVQQQPKPPGPLQTLESFVNLSTVATDSNYVVNVIDSDSQYLTFIPPGSTTAIVPTGPPSSTPPLTQIALSGGADGAALLPATDQNFELSLNPATGVGGFNFLDRVDIFNLLCVPGETDAPTISRLQDYCVTKRAFYIVDPPELSTPSSLQSTGPVGSTTGSITSGPKAGNSAYYFPWVEAPDPLVGNRPALFPPCGFVAGIYAATDASRGVWKAPAGIQAGITGASGLQYNLTDLENGDLNIQAINCLREFKVYGDVVWGARTLQGNDQAGSEWKYIPIRRLALFLESSLYEGTKWVVFEPNDAPLWGQIRLNVGAFMQGLFLKGAFQGSSPAQAYFVKCDAENNPQASIDLGIVNVLVGFAPLYPAEFVVIQIQQIAGQLA